MCERWSANVALEENGGMIEVDCESGRIVSLV